MSGLESGAGRVFAGCWELGPPILDRIGFQADRSPQLGSDTVVANPRLSSFGSGISAIQKLTRIEGRYIKGRDPETFEGRWEILGAERWPSLRFPAAAELQRPLLCLWRHLVIVRRNCEI